MSRSTRVGPRLKPQINDVRAETAALQRQLGGAASATSTIPTDPVQFLIKYVSHPVSIPWRAVVRALYGLPFADEAEAEAFVRVAGHSEPTAGGYTELEVVAGRRSGKSELGAALAVYEAVTGAGHMKWLPPGTNGHFMLISRSVKQSGESFRYARAMVERNPELAAELASAPLESQGGGTLTFRSGVSVSVHALSRENLRGFSILGAVMDETGWWATKDVSAAQDEEVISAVRFGMICPEGAPPRRLLVISSPGPKDGYLWDNYNKYHGKPKSPVLVAHGSTFTWNPSVSRAQLEGECQRDPRRFRREVEAEFVDAVNAFLENELVDAAAFGRSVDPLPYMLGKKYVAAVDMAFKNDSTVLCIGHVVQKKDSVPDVIVDGIWRWTPKPGAPLEAGDIVGQIATLLKRYQCRSVAGDSFGFSPLKDTFKRVNINLIEIVATNTSKLEAYGRLRQLLISRRISLPKHDVMLKELRSIEESITGSGNTRIAAPSRVGQHDDCASALAWLLLSMDDPQKTTAQMWADAVITPGAFR